MKKFITTFLILLPALCLYAQTTTTLTRERNSLRAGDKIIKQQVEFKDPGSNGKGLIWDFSMLQPVNEDYALNYFIPDSNRMDTVCGMEHRTRYYYRQHADSVWATGFENATTMMEYTRPELRLRFPFCYGDTLFSLFEGQGEYCHMLPLHVSGYTRIEADAEGELQLPGNETVEKALRIRTLRHYTETGKDSVEMTLDTYSWFQAGMRYPVFESVRTNLIKKLPTPPGEGQVNEMDTTVFTTSFFYPPQLQLSQVQTDSLPAYNDNALTGAAAIFTEAHLLPNPVTDNLYIDYTLTRDARVWFTVHTGGGIPVCQTTPQNLTAGHQNTTIPMRQLITGTYTLYVHVDDLVMKMTVVKK